MSYGVVLGLFDFKLGPYPVYFRDVTKDVASKVVIKGTIFQGSLQMSQSSGESIISFPSQSVSAYIYLYLLEDNGKELPILIAFITDIKDQSSLYKDAEDLRSISNAIKDEIINLKNFEKNEGLVSEISKIMDNKFTTNYVDKTLIKKSQEIPEHNQSIVYQIKPLNLLSRMVKKNLDQAIYGLIIGIPIVIYGKDVHLIKLTINTFEAITPHRTLKTNLVTAKIDNNNDITMFDIIGTSNSLKTDKNFILIDLEKGKIKGGRKNNYCENMLVDLLEAEEKNPVLLQMLAKRRINWLLTSVSTIIQLEDEKTQKDTIKNLTSKMDRDSLYLVAKLIEEKNPLMFKHILNSFNFRMRFFKSIF